MTVVDARPAGRALTRRELDAEVAAEVARIREEYGEPVNERRCHVCQNPEAKKRVNQLLTYCISDPEIARSVEHLNKGRPKNKRITKWSVRNHRINHFNLQEPALAGYRRMLARHQQADVDQFAEGAASMLTAIGYLDIIAHKGLETLVDPDTKVDYRDGVNAQLQKEKLLREGDIEAQMADLRRKVGLIQQAVLEQPEEVRHAISQRLAELTGTAADDNTIDVEYDDEDDDTPYNPRQESDPDDDLED